MICNHHIKPEPLPGGLEARLASIEQNQGFVRELKSGDEIGYNGTDEGAQQSISV